MFRNLRDDQSGFVNEGLEISDEYGSSHSPRRFSMETSSTKIEITRSQFNQERLHDAMKYKQPPSKSGESCFPLTKLRRSLDVSKHNRTQAQEQGEKKITLLSIKGERTTVSLSVLFFTPHLHTCFEQKGKKSILEIMLINRHVISVSLTNRL